MTHISYAIMYHMQRKQKNLLYYPELFYEFQVD